MNEFNYNLNIDRGLAECTDEMLNAIVKGWKLKKDLNIYNVSGIIYCTVHVCISNVHLEWW